MSNQVQGEKCSDAPDESLRALNEEAKKLFHEEKIDDAVKKYEEILGAESGSPAKTLPATFKSKIHSNLSMCWVRLGHGEKAVDQASAALALCPFDPKALYRMALAQNLQKRYNDALKWALEAMKMTPESKEVKRLIKSIQEASQAQSLTEKAKDTSVARLMGPINNLLESLRKSTRNDVCGESLREDQAELALDSIKAFTTIAEERGKDPMISLVADTWRDCFSRIIALLKELVKPCLRTSETRNSLQSHASVTTSSLSLQQRIFLLVWIIASGKQDPNALKFSRSLMNNDLVNSPEKYVPEMSRRREYLLDALPMEMLLSLFTYFVRKGVGDVMEDSRQNRVTPRDADKHYRSWCCIYIASYVSYVGCLESNCCLEILTTGLGCFECPDLIEVSLCSFQRLLDIRKRLGNTVKALSKSQALVNGLSAVLQHLPGRNSSNRKERYLGHVSGGQACGIFHDTLLLLADKDRPPEELVAIDELLLMLLDPYLEPFSELRGKELASGTTDQDKESDSLWNEYIVIKALSNAIWAAKDTVAEVLARHEHLLDCIVERAIEPKFPVPELQTESLQLLGHLLEIRSVRLLVLGGEDTSSREGLGRLTELYCTVKCPLIRAQLAVALVKLSIHSEATRESIFKSIDFLEDLSSLAATSTEILTGKTQNRLVSTDFTLQKGLFSGAKCCDTFPRACLELSCFLTLHSSFKESLLERKHLARNFIEFLAAYGESLSTSGTCGPGQQDTIMYAATLGNLLKTEDSDYEKRRTNAKESSIGHSREEVRAIQEFYSKLPEHCAPQRNGVFTRGKEKLSNEIRTAFFDSLGIITKRIVKSLLVVCDPKRRTSPATVAEIAEVLALFIKDPSSRAYVAQEKGLKILMKVADYLKQSNAVFYDDDIWECRSSMARICITVRSEIINYNIQLDLIPHLLSMLGSSYELHQYEGALALTNLMASSDQVRDRAFYGNAVSLFTDVATGENELCTAAGLEGLCNMALCDLFKEKIKLKLFKTELQIILAFLKDYGNSRGQCAASGCLAMLSSDSEVCCRVLDIVNSGNIITVADDQRFLGQPQLQIRVFSLWESILTHYLYYLNMSSMNSFKIDDKAQQSSSGSQTDFASLSEKGNTLRNKLRTLDPIKFADTARESIENLISINAQYPA